MARVDDKLSSIEFTLFECLERLSQMPKASDIDALRADISELKSQVNALPSSLTLFGAMLATWVAGAAIVGFMVK